MTNPFRIMPQPGIQRDGTAFDSDSCIDGQWTRFHNGRPKKMGGYSATVTGLDEIIRAISSYTVQGESLIHVGSQEMVQQIIIDSGGMYTGLNDRTPAALPADPDRLWQFDTFYDSAGGNNFLMALGPSNLNDISNENLSLLYYGDVQGTGVLTDTGVAGENGGITAVPPYLFKYGTNGHVAWCVPNDPSDYSGAGSGEAWVTSGKLVKGFPFRGNGQGPAVLLWSLDSIIRGSFVGSTAGFWAFDTLVSEISVLAQNGIIEYDGSYYWAAVDRFQVFNGVVREVVNFTNSNWFFNNLNVSQRQKVFAFKVPRYGEIWWCFPFGNATECTHAVVYNVRGGFWYDTILPEGGRSAGIFAKVYNKPFMAGVYDDSGYTLWQHETGVNKIVGPSIEPVVASFQTNEISLLNGDEPKDKSLSIKRLEPDFVQVGDMSVTVMGRANARAAQWESEPFNITEEAATAQEQTVPLKETRRLMSLKFESNTPDGDFFMGRVIAQLDEGDGRVTQ